MVNKNILQDPWKIATIILGIITLILVINTLFLGNSTQSSIISKESAGEKLVSFLNVQTGGGVEYVSAQDLGNNLYEITVSYNDDQIPVLVTKDGNYFIQDAVPLSDNPSPSEIGRAHV